MAVQFFIEERFKSSVVKSTEAPSYCGPFLLPDADLTYISGDFGSYLSQEITGDDFSLCEYRFFIKKKVLFYPYTDRPLLTLVYILKGTVNCLLQGFGPVDLVEGNYYFFYVPAGVNHEANFGPGDYVFFHINLDPNYLFKLTTRHPSMRELIRRQKENVSAGMRESSGPLTLKTRILIEQIMRSPEEDDARDMFLRGRIFDLLLLYSKDVERVSNIDAAKEANRDANKYMLKLMEAKNYIDAHRGKPLQIGALSRKLGINSQVLKKEFKAAFDNTIYNYQMQLRMHRACQLLLRRTVSIDQISEEIGYKNPSSFIEKFKQLFGITPYQYYKKYNK